jgi:hypothetical protein
MRYSHPPVVPSVEFAAIRLALRYRPGVFLDHEVRTKLKLPKPYVTAEGKTIQYVADWEQFLHHGSSIELAKSFERLVNEESNWMETRYRPSRK